ncbi:MAG: acyl-CoA thioesterase [Alloprevotella sp.]|nr:acyl-CoA thioesterase [Alloprevotella sp.]
MKETVVYEKAMEVRDYEADIQGIVNNANYLHYFEHTRNEYLRHKGFDFVELHHRGIDTVVARADIRFRQSLHPSDRFVCRLAVRKEGVRFIFRQTIVREGDNAVCAEGETTVVCLINGRLGDCEELSEAFHSDFYAVK